MTNRVVTKALAGVEDLLLGSGTVNQTRNGNTLPITKIDAASLIYENAETLRTKYGKKVESVATIAAMKAIDVTTDGEIYVHVRGNLVEGDGFCAIFWLDTSDTASAESDLIYEPSDLTVGRWKLVDTEGMVSPDRGDANYVIAAYDYGIQLFDTALTANRAVTLPGTPYTNQRVTIVKTKSDVYTLTVGTHSISGVGILELFYDGAAWIDLNVASSTTSSESYVRPLNASFEVDSNGDGAPDDWTLAPESGGSITIDSTDPANGANSLKFASTGFGGGSATSEFFRVSSNALINFTLNYRSSVATTLNKLELAVYNKNQVIISTRTIFERSSGNPSSNEEFTEMLEIPPNATYGKLIFTGVDPSGTVTSGTTTHLNYVKVDDIIPSFETQFKCHETLAPSMTVEVDAGTVQSGNTLVSKLQQTSATIVAPVVNPRIDRIVIDKDTGVVAVVTGAEAASPTAPAISASQVAIAQIALAITTTTITNSLITDERALSFTPYPGQIVSTSTTAIISTNDGTAIGAEPLIADGIEVFNLDITPQDANSKLKIEWSLNIGNYVPSVVALFDDTDTLVHANILTGTGASTGMATQNGFTVLASPGVATYNYKLRIYTTNIAYYAHVNRSYASTSNLNSNCVSILSITEIPST